jgi:hypothetical protein
LVWSVDFLTNQFFSLSFAENNIRIYSFCAQF